MSYTKLFSPDGMKRSKYFWRFSKHLSDDMRIIKDEITSMQTHEGSSLMKLTAF